MPAPHTVRSAFLATVLGVCAIGATPACSAAESASQAASPQAAPSDTASRVAAVDGEPITLAELEEALGQSLAKLEQDMYTLKRDRLDMMIGERLLAKEAASRGITVEQLVEAEVGAKIVPVGDAEVDAFYEANKARMPDRPDIKGEIRAYLDNTRRQTRGQEYIAELRGKMNVEVLLPRPAIRRAELDIEGAPIRGNESAPVTIVEFSDFHCPFCRQVQPTLVQLLARYPNQVRLVYMDLPLEGLHPQARRAAEAARCARDQGKFWEFHDKVFQGTSDASPEYLRSLAAGVGLDVAAFDACLTSGKHQAGVQAHLNQGSGLGITGTPSFFVNGRALTGAQPFEAFAQVIDEELRDLAAQ
jgi:protein-disulfide isomerase